MILLPYLVLRLKFGNRIGKTIPKCTYKFVPQGLLPLLSLHVESSHGQEALTKSAWKAVLDPEETIKAVSGLEVLVFEKCGTPDMEISRGHY